MTANISHVVVAGIAFVAHIPKNRGKAVLFGGRNNILVPLHATLLVEIQVAAVQFRRANVCTKLADNDRIALVHVICLHLGKLFLRMHNAPELGIDRARPGVVTSITFSFARLSVIAIIVLRQNHFTTWSTPVLRTRHECVLIRVIVVHFEHQAAFDFVFREGAYRSVCDRLVDVSIKALNNQGSGFVVATRSAHGINERLVVVHKRRHMLRCPRVHIRAGFIGAREKQPFVVVLKLVCNLRPVSFHLVVDVAIDARADVALEPTTFTFVVDVEDCVKTCAHGVIDNRLHRIEPSFGHLTTARVTVPSARDTHRIEACRLHGIEQSLSRERIAPGRRIVRHFHRVADIEAHAHLGLNFFCCWKCSRRNGTCKHRYATGNSKKL